LSGSVLTDGVWQSVTPGNGVAPSSPATVSASVGFKELGCRDKAAVEKVPYAHLIVESAPMAEGSYKSVYRATWHRGGDRASPTTVALLKVRSSEGDASALAAEVQVFVELGKHPHLATLLGTAKHPDGSACMLVEYAPLGSLDGVLVGPAGGGCETSEEVRLTVATQICEGMAQLALHGVVHRDLASRNVSGPRLLCSAAGAVMAASVLFCSTSPGLLHFGCTIPGLYEVIHYLHECRGRCLRSNSRRSTAHRCE